MSLQVEDLMVKMVNNEFGACNTGLLNVGYYMGVMVWHKL